MRRADLLTAGPPRSAIATDLRTWLPLLAGALTPRTGQDSFLLQARVRPAPAR